MKDIILFPIRLVLGLLLYVFSKDFRNLVQGKLRRGTNETVKGGEEVVAVLVNASGKKKTIGENR